MEKAEQKSDSVTLSSFTSPNLIPPPHTHRLRSSTRFVAIIENNLQYNLVCSFLKWSDNISPDHEWSSGGQGWGDWGLLRFFSLCGYPTELAFMTSCLAASTKEFTNPVFPLCARGYTPNRQSVIWRKAGNKYLQYKRSAEVDW